MFVLVNQTNILDKQRRAYTATQYVSFLAKEDTAHRLWKEVDAKWQHISTVNVNQADDRTVDGLRHLVHRAKPSETLAEDVVDSCGLRESPVAPLHSADAAIAHIGENDIEAATAQADDLRKWMEGATIACEMRYDLMRRLTLRAESELDLPPEEPPD